MPRRGNLTPLGRGVAGLGSTFTPTVTLERSVLEPTRLGPSSAPTSLAYQNFSRLLLDTSPEKQFEYRGLIAPTDLILRPLRLQEAWTWDARWRGSDVIPSVSYYETQGTAPDAPIVKRFWDPTVARVTPKAHRSWTIFDARDRLICGGGGCNQPYGTWFAIAPASDRVYCSPDTLVSVLFQEPRYRTAQEALRAELASPPSVLPAEPAERNAAIAANAEAWAGWCMRVDALTRMAIWATNVRPELLYDWLDPAGSIKSVRTVSDASSPTGTRTTGYERRGFVGNPDSWVKEINRRNYPLLTQEDVQVVSSRCWGRWPLYKAKLSPGTRYVREEATRLDLAAGNLVGHTVPTGMSGVSARRMELFSCHLWNANNNHRNLSRWLTHRYPLTAACFKTGTYTTGGKSEWATGGGWQHRSAQSYTDLPVRSGQVQIPMDYRYFAVDNTIPIPVLSANYGWLAFSADGWAQTPGEHSRFYDVPGVFSTTVECRDATLDECVRRTQESLRRFFASARSGERSPWSDQNNPVIARVRPAQTKNWTGNVGSLPTRGDNEVVFAPYLRAEKREATCQGYVAEPKITTVLDASGEPVRAVDQYVWIPSPDSYVRAVTARARDVADTSFGGMLARGTLMYADLLEFYSTPDRPWLSTLPPGARPQDLRALASSFTKMEHDQAASIIGATGGTLASAIGLVSGPIGALVAALVAVAVELTARAQELKLARGGNPITIPMAFVRFMEADAQNLLAECDFNPGRAGYDATIPQVAVVQIAAQEGWIGDAVRLFGSLSEAVGSVDVPEQEEYVAPAFSDDGNAALEHGDSGDNSGGDTPRSPSALTLALPVAAVLAAGALLWSQRK